MNGADIWNLIDLEVEHALADESGNQRGDHLRREGLPRRDLDVVRELEVLRE